MTYSEFPGITKTTPANHVPEILQPRHFISTSTNPDGSHMSNYIRQIEVNMTNEPLKIEQPLLESSSEMDKLACKTNTKHYQNYCDGDKLSCSRSLGDGDFQLTENWSAKYLLKNPKNAIYCFPEAPEKSFLKNLYRKSLNICNDHCRSAVVLT